jgi:hypothetical protein
MADLAQYWHVIFIVTILIIVATTFIRKFIYPARLLGRQLDNAVHKLEIIRDENGGHHFTDVERVAREAMVNERLAHCWSEFKETLHPQTRVNNQGQEEVTRWRATALAETFFTDQALVETPLKTEFYKHLPGILTGIGIIGTFSGLILGLVDFQVSTDADAVRQSLANLIQNVGHAFIVSAIAIALAMLFTWIEKSLVTGRFRQVEQVCRLLDSMFDAGAGEEYLSRLVHASETSATQSAQIKDALVADLKEILAEMTRQQVEAMAHNNQQLSDTMVRTFTEGLKDPMERISSAVEKVGGNQGEAVNRLLTDVLSSFTTQMKGMFGGQLLGMNDVLKQTTQAIQEAAGKFDQLAGGLQDAGKGAIEEMAKRLDEALISQEQRQKEMNATMSEFIEAIRNQVSDSQQQTTDKLTVMLTDLGNQTATLIGTMQDQGRQASENHSKHQDQLAQQSQATLDQLAGNVSSLTDSVQAATAGMQSAVGQLTNTTRESVDRMNTGADTLQTASTTLAQNLNNMSAVVEKVSGTSDKLNLTAQSLSGATQAAMQVINDYRATRDTFASMVSDLKSTVENARREASLTSEFVNSLQSASEKLAAAQKDAEGYLEGVTEVLALAHEEFAKNVEKTLHKGNAQFHKELAEATNLLKGAIQDLGDTLDVAVARA